MRLTDTAKFNLESLNGALELGTGAFGTVHRATWKPVKDVDNPEKGTWQIKVAVKTLNEPKSSILEEALTMVKISFVVTLIRLVC